jgi:hypothetical protein
LGDGDQTTSAEVHALARAIGLDQAYAGGGVALTTVINDIIYWADRLLDEPGDELAIDGARRLATETPESVAFWFDRHADREVRRAVARANGSGRRPRAREHRVESSG